MSRQIKVTSSARLITVTLQQVKYMYLLDVHLSLVTTP